MNRHEPAPDLPTEPVRLLVSDAEGRIYDHPSLVLCGVRGGDPTPVPIQDLIPLPRGSDLFTLPGRRPVGLDPATGQVTVLSDWMDGEARAVATFLAPAHTSCHHAAWETVPDAPRLPTYAYTAVGMADERYWASAVRVDPDPRQDPWRFDQARVEAAVVERRSALPTNRVVAQLERCALEYHCRAAQNYFLGRHEAPLPVSVACNAQCVGCISLQPDGEFRASHDRLNVAPKPEEVAELALGHLERVPDGVVSYGQGCEGEPLLLGPVLVEATRLIRTRNAGGTVNLNSNASKPDVVERMCAVGLDSIRASLNSPRPDVYAAYYNPRGYTFAEVRRSLEIVKQHGGHTAINLLCFPGVTDTDAELAALSELVEGVRLDMIQMRNLNIDPALYAEILPPGTVSEGRGMRWLMHELSARFPYLRYGYFNPPVGPRTSGARADRG
jgi:wyosine [tRNA(Phe)-imidazoG37] synthetase (radical SAM superfamily)